MVLNPICIFFLLLALCGMEGVVAQDLCFIFWQSQWSKAIFLEVDQGVKCVGACLLPNKAQRYCFD